MSDGWAWMRRGDWLQGLGLWNSVTGLDVGSCGVGLSWALARRCCLFLGNLGLIDEFC